MNLVERVVRDVRRHQAGLLLDTNVLLVHLADTVDPSLVSRWKVTRHVEEDFVHLLRYAVGAAKRYVTTPHILTEAANLAERGSETERTRRAVLDALRKYAERARERFRPSRELVQDDAFTRLGLADVAQLRLPLRRRPLVLTIDGPLTIELERRRLPVTNLNHLLYPT